MRAALMAYFDLGYSMGLGDQVFGSDATAVRDPGAVGLVNPLGEGIRADVPVPIVERWCMEAAAQARRPGMEMRWREGDDLSPEQVRAAVIDLVSAAAVRDCHLSIHAIGAVVVWLELREPIDPRFMHGVCACFEFAGYLPAVADELHRLARSRCAPYAEDGGARPLVELTRRERPGDVASDSGYTESRLFSFFTRLALCIDDGDADALGLLAAHFDCGDESISFAYHGVIYPGPAPAIVARSILGDRSDPDELPEVAIERMVQCLHIAHVFQAACDALSRLFVAEMNSQVDTYVKGSRQGRSAGELNRLRTLALAVVSLTDVTLITPSDEDQALFTRLAENARLDRLRASVQASCEILYSVQAAEEHEEEEQRANRLSSLFALLTTLTFLSVAVDAYSYIRDDDPLLVSRPLRTITLLLMLAACVVIFVNRSRPRP